MQKKNKEEDNKNIICHDDIGFSDEEHKTDKIKNKKENHLTIDKDNNNTIEFLDGKGIKVNDGYFGHHKNLYGADIANEEIVQVIWIKDMKIKYTLNIPFKIEKKSLEEKGNYGDNFIF